MSKRELSAKDKAFEQERIKYRKEIISLKHEIESKDKRIKSLSDQVNTLENRVNEYNDWIQRLLEYCDLDEEFMKNKIKIEKNVQLFGKVINDNANHLGLPYGLIANPFLDMLGTLACLGGPKDND